MAQPTTAFIVAISALLFSACDDTSAAIDERAQKERAELRAEVEQLRHDLRAAEAKAEARAEQLDRQATQMKVDAEHATERAVEQGKRALEVTGNSVKETVDRADKAVAGAIRDDS